MNELNKLSEIDKQLLCRAAKQQADLLPKFITQLISEYKERDITIDRVTLLNELKKMIEK